MQNIQLNNSIAIIINTSDIYGAIKDIDTDQISLEIQNEAEEVVKIFTYSDIQKIDIGKYQAIFTPEKTGYMRYFWQYKITGIPYKSAGEMMIKEFIPLPPAKIEIGSGTITPGSGAEIDDSITSALKAWSSFKINSELSKKSDLGHLHDSLYSPLSHNHNSLYSPTTHKHDDLYSAIGHSHTQLHSSFLMGSKSLDETSLDDQKAIVYDSISDKLIFKTISSSGGGAAIDDAATNSTNTWSSSKIATELETKAATTHNHDEIYAPAIHAHTEYSLTTHKHKSSISFCFPEPAAGDESPSFFAPRALIIKKMAIYCRTFVSGILGAQIFQNGASVLSTSSAGPSFDIDAAISVAQGDNIYIVLTLDGYSGAKNTTVTLFVE